jgi:hypothetical protein
VTAIKSQASRQTGKQRKSPSLQKSSSDFARHIVHDVCCLAGSALLDDIRTENNASLRSAIARHDTAAIFNWLMVAFSYQGVSDQVAAAYMRQHGKITWQQVRRDLAKRPTCPKLRGYEQFKGCRYDKGSGTCSEPEHIAACPLPTHRLRNGRLNQTAFSLFLFTRDVAGGDLVSWIDRRLTEAAGLDYQTSVEAMRENLLAPLRGIFGVADKVLSMALSSILLADPEERPHWLAVGGSMIAIDTLVHNFLHRTGILARFDAEHAFGAGCYRPGTCAALLTSRLKAAVMRRREVRD